MEAEEDGDSLILRGCLRKNVRLASIFVDNTMLRVCSVKNLMYGFGDDRNPANDTVNVMEEILIEYITDVVRTYCTSSI